MPPAYDFLRRRRVLTATAVAISSLALLHCDQRPAPTPSPEPVATETRPAPAVQKPAPLAALTREDLVKAAAQAAAGYGAGRRPAATDPLVGRRFSARLAFGCSGSSSGPEGAGADGVARWSWGPDRKTIQISLKPGDWTSSALIGQPQTVGSAPWEAVEGFWIPRPWLGTETCPLVASDPLQTAPPPVSPQTVGLAAVFEAEGSRIGRRNGKAYTFTVRGQADEAPAAPPSGYRLLLEGRIVGFPDGRAFRCRASGPDQRPVCVAAVQLDKVAFEDDAGAVMSEWQAG